MLLIYRSSKRNPKNVDFLILAVNLSSVFVIKTGPTIIFFNFTSKIYTKMFAIPWDRSEDDINGHINPKEEKYFRIAQS